MSKENSQDGGAQPTNDEGTGVDVTPAVEEAVDTRIEKAISPIRNIKPDPLEEADKELEQESEESDEEGEDAQETDEKPDPKPEAKAEEKVDEAKETPSAEPILPTREPSSIDKRIVKVYQETQVLKGAEVPEMEEILKSIRSGSLAEKKAALHRLLAERKQLRGDTEGTSEMGEEDREALIQAEADERLEKMRTEIAQREWEDDLVLTVESHPELRPDAPEYNQRIEAAVSRLVDGGMKASEAYSLVMESVNSVVEEEKKKSEIKKQKALSGAVTGASFVDEAEEMSSEDIRILRTTRPREYNRLVRLGKI